MTVDFGNLECAATKIVGIYPCCQQRVLHFDPSLEGTVSELHLSCALLSSGICNSFLPRSLLCAKPKVSLREGSGYEINDPRDPCIFSVYL